MTQEIYKYFEKIAIQILGHSQEKPCFIKNGVKELVSNKRMVDLTNFSLVLTLANSRLNFKNAELCEISLHIFVQFVKKAEPKNHDQQIENTDKAREIAYEMLKIIKRDIREKDEKSNKDLTPFTHEDLKNVEIMPIAEALFGNGYGVSIEFYIKTCLNF